jgi:hypothetical protein
MAKKNWQTVFLNELAETSNVKPDFARRWYEALAAGYDNLEMDLLCRLREGRLEDADSEGNKRKFDIGTAFKCLIAHRETVARTKGRKTLEDELATMKSINAKIDKIREREERAAELEAKRARRTHGK